jgi:pimeloyl-ACP methyl ester carboxylesterase
MKEIELPLTSFTMRAIRYGEEHKPVLLALHGWLDNAASFAPIAEYLNDYQIIALDFAGHGKSDHRAKGAHYHLIDNVQDLHEAIEFLELSDVTLFGHSMGGIIAAMYAACFPEVIHKLVVVESFGPLTMEPQSSPEQLRKSIASRLENAAKTARHPESLQTAIKARMMAGKMHGSSAELLMKRNIDDSGDFLKWRTDPRLRTISSLRLTEEQSNSFIESVTCPWLAIFGSEGFQKLKVNLEKRKDLVPNLIAETCPGGHHLHMDEPGPVSEKIIGFLQDT